MRTGSCYVLALTLTLTLTLGLLAACDDDGGPMGVDPDTAPKASIDRFSAEAGTLFVRGGAMALPEPNAPIDFDATFRTLGLGPAGELVEYYNFDVQPNTPIPIYVLFREGETDPVAGQLNIVDAIPGDPGYNDFWQVHTVDVPPSYVANTITSASELFAAGHPINPMVDVVNCPIVPEGSTALDRVGGGDAGLVRGWYRGQVVFYFAFMEHPLTVMGGVVPTAAIYVTFNVNPGQPGGGPESGFVTEPASSQTHNVLGALPPDAYYSPLWEVNPYDNAAFDTVTDLTTAEAATAIGQVGPAVNCPLASIN